MRSVIENPISVTHFFRILFASGALITLILVIINIFRHDEEKTQDMALRTAVLSLAFGVLMLLTR